MLTAIVIGFAMTAVLLVLARARPCRDTATTTSTGTRAMTALTRVRPARRSLPIVVPLLAGALLLVCSGGARPRRAAARRLRSPLLAVLVCAVGARARGPPTARSLAYLAGNWPAPFGIALALDRLAALMLLLTAVVALACLLARRRRAGAARPACSTRCSSSSSRA